MFYVILLFHKIVFKFSVFITLKTYKVRGVPLPILQHLDHEISVVWDCLSLKVGDSTSMLS